MDLLLSVIFAFWVVPSSGGTRSGWWRLLVILPTACIGWVILTATGSVLWLVVIAGGAVMCRLALRVATLQVAAAPLPPVPLRADSRLPL